MAIVSKEITWTGATKQELSNLLSTDSVNATWLSDSSAYIQIESANLQRFIDFLATKGIIVTVVGDGPAIPAPEAPEPIPSGTVLDNTIWQQATNEIREEDRQAILTRVNARYDSLGGTREP